MGRDAGAFEDFAGVWLNVGGAGSATTPGAAAGAAGDASAAGGRDGGRGGVGLLRLAPGGTESGFCLTGGGGGRLRAGSLDAVAPAEAAGGAAGVAAGAAEAAGVGPGRGGIDGGIDERPDVGRGGAGFFEGVASSAIESRAYTKPETTGDGVLARLSDDGTP